MCQTIWQKDTSDFSKVNKNPDLTPSGSFEETQILLKRAKSVPAREVKDFPNEKDGQEAQSKFTLPR